jgi:hypothetical protein
MRSRITSPTTKLTAALNRPALVDNLTRLLSVTFAKVRVLHLKNLLDLHLQLMLAVRIHALRFAARISNGRGEQLLGHFYFPGEEKICEQPQRMMIPPPTAPLPK